MEPTVLILDVGKNVKQLQNVLRQTGELWESPKEIFQSLADCVQDPTSCYTNLLEYVGRVKHGQERYLAEDKLVRLGIAVGDLGLSMITAIEQIGLYDNKEKLHYHYYGLCGHSFVLKREKTIFER